MDETREYTGPGFHIWFGESFWKDDPSCRGRSRELTPLYLTRYQAARGEGQLVLSQTWEFSCTLAGRGTLRSSHNIDLEPATIYLIPPGVLARGGLPHRTRVDLDGTVR